MTYTPDPRIAADPLALTIWAGSSRTASELDAAYPRSAWLTTPGEVMIADWLRASDWLAEHDREVAEKAWDEGYSVGNAHDGRRDASPYRQAPDDSAPVFDVRTSQSSSPGGTS